MGLGNVVNPGIMARACGVRRVRTMHALIRAKRSFP